MVNISTEIRSKYNIRNKLSIGIVLILLVLYIIYTNEHLNRYSSYYGTSTLVETAITTLSTTATTTATPSQREKDNGAIQNQRVIDRSEATFPKEQVQMCWEQVQYILQHLPKNGNMLVWGLGYDSIYWNTVTTGKVVFLEDGDMITNLVPNPNPNNPATMVRWFDSMTYQYPQLQAYTVNYTTQNSISQLEYYKNNKDAWDEQLYIHDLPDILSSTIWDVIIVDAPLGYPKTGPGRFQSIYMTKKIANHTLTLLSTEQPQRREESEVTTNHLRNDQEHAVHVFVDDYERRVEREFALAVFHPVVPERVTPRPAYKQHVTPNEQAHFILSLSNMR